MSKFSMVLELITVVFDTDHATTCDIFTNEGDAKAAVASAIDEQFEFIGQNRDTPTNLSWDEYHTLAEASCAPGSNWYFRVQRHEVTIDSD